MTRAARIAVCAIAAVLMASVGTTANALPARHGGTHHHHRHLEHDGSTRVLLALGRLDRQLARSIRHRLSPLTDADRAIVRANAASDQATVEAVATAYSSTPSDHHLDLARGLLRSYHPQRYIRGTAILRRAGRCADTIVRIRPSVAPGSRAATELRTAARLLGGIRPHTITAHTSSAAMARVRHAVQRARSLVQHVRAGLARR
ncbi:MAG TPA: hypothetical protein VHW64_06300 [Nocardioides sp.]|jgi:hypothetical protein|uniref:hypothetical protein n=1 Tax=Nocardioides sp. TaxID=35761 RepID=UPI002E359808|nr:hypothetical protein [Nocardioides sp.]HEX3930296.1 hypothetical protein [Nocardioides sp.]